ncbi:hypothetical protein ACGFNX_38165 [Streptomyces sp. NPDC048723]|uniref:hypothetical protein n=1 Tax=Streptomyces sp. NPDC048723 TaxID=3365589 RepID=UPI003712E019
MALLRARRHVQVAATALAGAGVATPEVMAALTEISREPAGYEPPADEHDFWDVMAIQDRGTARTGNRITAAVSWPASVGRRNPRSRSWRRPRAGGSPWPGTSARPAALASPSSRRRWRSRRPRRGCGRRRLNRRISGDPYARCVPVLADLVRTRPCSEGAAPPPSALATLAELGVTPDEIRHHLRTWADSERRIIPCYGRHGPLDDDLLREAARAHLSLLADR